MPATKYTRYNDIPQLTRGGSWECDFNLDEAVRFVRNKDEQVGLDLDPDFQRGHAWNEAQQIAWLEFFIRGGKTGRALYFNQPSWMMRATTAYDDFVIVDGKQRYKAIERFIGGEIKVYGSYVGEYMGWLLVDDWVFALPHPVPSLFTAALRLGASVGVVCEMADRQHGGEDIEHVKLPTFAALERTVSLLATCIYHLGTDYATVLEGQVTKIHDRNRRGVVAGNGDHR